MCTHLDGDDPSSLVISQHRHWPAGVSTTAASRVTVLALALFAAQARPWLWLRLQGSDGDRSTWLIG